MIELHDLKITGSFRYLWLKYVTGVDLEVHCAKCLVGEYSTAVKKDVGETELIELDEFPAKIFYLCGVAIPFKWENNFHLAFEEATGEEFRVDELGISVTVRNAHRLPITTEAMNEINHPRIGNKSYSTCRNWQFANYLKRLQNLKII